MLFMTKQRKCDKWHNLHQNSITCNNVATMMFEWTRNLYASNERLHRLGKVETPQCSFCDQTDHRWHMFYCKHNEMITSNLKKIIGEVCEEPVSPTKLALVDFNPPELYRLAVLFSSLNLL